MSILSKPANAQCTVSGVSGSGFLFASACAPASTVIYYEFTFSVMPPNPTYRVQFLWGDGTFNNVYPAVQSRVVAGITVYYIRAELAHNFPANGLCEYEVLMQMIDNNSACLDSRQFQVIGNWHQDDIALANGQIDITPAQEDVCEGLPLIDFQFADATHFSCNIQDNPTAQKPNHTPRHEQFVYGTDPAAGQGIPNLFIKVGTAQTVVYLTDNSGNPITGPWNVDPVTGATVMPYMTQSGYFEGPIVAIPVDPVTGTYALNNTYPISFNGVGTVAGDRFEVTVRNWNICNPWNGSQTAPNAGEANTDDAIILIVDGPLANAGPDATVCEGDPFNTDGVLVDGTSALWTSTGNGSFTNATSPNNANYTAGAADLAQGWVDLVLHAYATGMCPEHTDTMRLTFDPLPAVPVISVSAGANNFCDNNSLSVTLSSTPSPNGQYLWRRNGASTGVTTQTITLNDYTQAGDYTVTVYGTTALECPRTSAPYEVIIGQPATVNAGTDQTICSNNPASLAGTIGGSAGSATWSTSGTGSFGSATSLSTTYTPSAADITAGTVTLTLLTNNPAGPCPAVSDFLVLTIIRAPQVNAGADATTCQGVPYTVNDATASDYVTLTWSENGTGSITAGQGTLTPTYTPGAAELNATVTLTLTATGTSPCASTGDTKILYVDRTPVATAGPVQEICNNTSASLAGNTPAAGTFGEWTFINNLVWQETFAESPQFATSGTQWTTSGITPDSDTYFRVESGRIVGRDLDAEAVWMSDPINISAVSPVKVSVNLQEPSSLESNDYIRVYYSLNGGPEILFTTNGNNTDDFANVTASVTNLSGNFLQIIIRCRNNENNEYYYIDNLSVRQVTAVAEPTITTFTSPTSTVTDLWQGDNHFRWSVFSNHNGCDSASAVYTIRRDISPAAANAGPAQTYCETSSTVLAANAATNGGTGTWSLVSGSGTVSEPNNPLSAVTGLGYGANTFRWTITSALGICPGTNSTVTITRNRNPLDLSGNVTIVKNPVCYNTPGQLQITGTEADVKYYLRTGGVDGTFVQGNGGTITLTTPNLTSSTTFEIHAIKDVTGCNIIFGSYTINVNPAFTLAQLQASHNICALATTTISVVLTGGTSPYTIVWNDGSDHTINNYVSGTPITIGPYPVGNTTISLVSVLDNNLCVPASLGTPIIITVGSTPTVATLTGTGDACVGSTSTLTFTVTNGVPPYDIIINGVTYLDRNSGSSISLGALPVGNYTYNLTSVIDACGNPVPAGGLPPAYSFSINEIPSANGTANNAPVICSNGVTDIVLQSTVVGSTFTWTVSHSPAVTWLAGKAPAAGSGVIGTVIGQNLQHTGAEPVTVVYAITPAGPASTFCPGPQITRSVVVNPTAELNDPAEMTVCTGSATAVVTFTTNRTGGTTTYSWSNNNTAIGLGASGNGNLPSFTAVNTGSSPVSATITVTPSFEGCPGTPQTFTITVNPTAQVNDPADQVHCNGTAVPVLNFGTDRTGGSTTYEWTNSNTAIGLAASGSGPLTAFTATNSGTAPISATITVTPTFANGGASCAGTAQTFTITVNPSAQVDDPANQVHCNGAAVPVLNFGTDRTGGTTTYAWTNSNTATGLAAGGSGPLPAFTATNGGTAPITATVTVTPTFDNGGQSCSGTPQTFTITVNPSAQVNDPADQVRCNNAAVPALTFTTNRTGGSTTYEWTNSNTAIGLVASGTGGLPAFTATNGGTAPISATITVTPTFSNGGQSCSGTAQTFTITVNPSAQVNDPADQVHCNGDAVPAFTFTTDRTGGTTTYAWTNSNTSIGLAAIGSGPLPAFTATNSGTAPVTATVTVTPTFSNGGQSCSGTPQTFTITVNPTPALNSTLTPPDVCSNSLFTYTPASLTSGTSFSWTRLAAAGITPAGPVTGINGVSETLRNLTSATIAVTYEYVLTANGCSHTQNVVVNIKPEPVISNQSVSVCSGETLTHHILLDNFVNPGDNVTFTWPAPVLTGGLTGGSDRTVPSSADMTGTFVNTSGLAETATYTVTPVYNGCVGEPKTIVVTVGSQPVLGNLNMFACSAIPTGLVMAVAPTSSPATTYDIASIAVQAGLVAGAGNAVAANGINDASYLANDTFTNETGVNRTVTYRIRPVFGATCIGDWVDVVVTIRPQPVIVPGQHETVCSNVPASLEILLLSPNTPAGSTFSWSLPFMSDGSTQGTTGTNVAADPVGTLHITDTFENYGINPITATYTVTPYSSFGCAGTPVDVVITVNPEPAAPVITGDDMLCTSQTNVIYTVPLTPGSSYTWTVPAVVGTKVFDANSNAIIINAAAVAGSGTITVTETNSFGCTGMAGSFDVDVMAPAPVSVIAGDNIVCALETGVYSVPDNTGSIYTWTLPTGAALIGDPSAASITVTFGTISGNITVREVNAAGCITNHTPLPVTVRPLPTAVISNSGTVCIEDVHPINITLTGAAPWVLVYAINGADQPAVNIGASPHTLDANAAGNYTVTSVTDANGCTNTGIGNATVSYWPVPTATISGTTAVCAGQSATLTISLTGASPYDFTYTDGVTPVTVMNHPVNIYTFTVTPASAVTYTLVSMEDNNGCNGNITGTATVTINAQPVLAFAVTNLQCNGDNSGAINLTVSGSASNSFSWLGPDGFTAGTEDISGVKAGLYNVTVTSGDGCVASGQATVFQPAVLTLSSTGNMVLLCNGDPTGAGSFTAAGGTAPYTFTTLVNTAGATLTSAASSVAVTDAGGGTITVRVTDAHNCIAESTIIVTEPPALSLASTVTNVSCFGGNNGTIIISVTGGTAPYIYAWTASGGGSGITAGAPNQGGLTAGTYDLTVTDANGCVITGTWTITQPTVLAVTASADDNLIGTCSSAQLTATVTGGVEPAGGYLYSWSPAAGLSATNISNPVATPSSTTTYTVTVTDANGCVKTASVTVNVAPVLTAVAFADDNLIGACPTSQTQLHVNANGGEAPYSFSWLPAAGLSNAAIREPMAKPVANSTYTVTVTDANGCTATANVTVNVAPELDVTATVDDNLIGTCLTSVAHLSATATGGEGAYTYLWDNAGTLTSATSANPTAKPLATTTYTVTVTDANGCTDQATIIVNVAPPLSVTATADDLFIGTCPTSVSHLDATVVGGEPGYTYRWTPLTGLDDSNIKTPTAKPAVTTTYTVTVTDVNGCTATSNITITVRPALSLTLAVDDSSIGTCPGSEAHITSTAGGGEPGYIYLWTPAAGLSSDTDPNPTAKPAVTTTYTLTVTDQNGCSISRDITVNVVSPLTVTASAADPLIGTCPTSNTTLNAVALGGEPGYTYSWLPVAGLDNPSIQTPLAKPLVTTIYTVTVTDNNGCTATANVTVTVAPDLTAVATVDDGTIGTCPTSVAHLDVTATGGEPGYTYLWAPVAGLSDPNSKTPTAKPSATTTYTVTVTDANGCQTTASIEVIVAPVLNVTVSADDYNIGTCPASDAQLTASASGGEPGYTYLWSPATGLSDATIANPTAKPAVTTSYTVLVTDVNGCTATASLTITVAPVLAATATVSDPNIGTCPTSQTTLDVIVTGGEPGYTYLWAPATGLSDVTSKTPTAKPAVTTTYTVTVTDNNGCQTTAPVIVTVLPDLVVTATADDLLIGTCPTSRSNLGATVTGGEAGYTYSWAPATGLNNPNVSNPIAKPSISTTYTVTVTDANGCQASDDITVTVAPELTVSATADDEILSTCPTSVAQITATALGGEELAAGGYTWSWAPSTGLSATNIPNPVAKPASTTTYTVTVTDANGCTAVNTITIEVRPPLTAIATATDYLIGSCPASTTTLDVNVTGGELPYIYSWVPAASLSDATVKSPVAKPAVNTTYTVTVTDANGCTVTATVSINIAPPLAATAAVDDDPIGACPSSVAHLSTTVSGGEGGYTYLWNNAGTLDDATRANPTAKPAVSTLYTVTVTDANGCQTTAQVQVNVAPDLTVTATADDDIIGACPTSVAMLTATGAGGELLLSGDYIYNWSPAAGLNYTNVQSPMAKPAVTTTYTVTITDRNGCTASDQITITVMPPIALTTTPVVYAGGYNVSCNGASDGAIDLEVAGGEVPFAYAWSGPSGFTSTAQDISGLRAGTYTVTVTDANNCTSTTTVVLLEPAVLTLGRTPDVVLACFGDATATGSFSVSGGTAPYIISVVINTSGATVNITGTSLSFTGGAAGEVTAGVVDANGCSAQATILITQPPQLMPGAVNGDQEVCFQGNPTLLGEVTAPSGGPATILFQWERSLDGGTNWSDVSGANMASYDPPAGILQTTHFRRRVNSASCDPAYSNTVVVTVNPLPVASIAGTGFVCPGDAATVTVTITTGETPFTVLLSDGTTVSNYSSGDPITVNPFVTTTYTITSVTDNNGCTVAAPHADITGSATIDVKVVPGIAIQPLSVTVCEDDVATFTTDAGGTTNPHYQWYVDSGSGMTLMPAETAATLSVTATSGMNGYEYQAEISGDCPVPVLSDIVTLTVNEKPEIITQPADVTLCSGEDAIFTVDAGVTTNPVYQWYVDSGSGWTPATGARYQGASTSTLTVVSALEMMSGYRYMVRVSGTCTPYAESIPVSLTVTRQAEITQHPASLTLCEGQAAIFTVNAGLTTNPSYQWERSLDGGTTWTPIAGATTATHTIAAVVTADNNTAYRAVVSSTCGSSLTSLPAFLTVNELPEITDQPDDVVICEYAIADFIVDAGVTTGATYRWQRSINGGTSWNNLTETATYFGVSTMNLKVNGTNRMMSGDMFRVIISGTCTPPDTSDAALLTVNTAPEILAQPVAATICENTNTAFNVSAQGTALTYQWFVDTGSGFTAVTDGGVYSGAATNTLTLTTVPRTYDNYRYRVEVEGSCAPKAISQTVLLDVSIETIITQQPADSAICEFMTSAFTALAGGANLTYQWQAFTGGVWTDLTNSGIYMGVTTPTLMVFGPSRTMDGTRYRVVIGGDCSADLISDEAVLTVYTAPELSDHPDEFRGCPGSSATFSVTAAGTGLIYQWQVNSGSGFVNVTDNATYAGTATPTLIVNNLDLSMNGYLIRVVVSGTCLPPVTSSFAPLRVYMEPSIISEPADAEVCDLSGAIFYSQVFNTGAGETTVWQVNQGAGWSILSDGPVYQGTQTPQLVITSATTAMNGWHYRLEITGPCGLYYTREALLTVNAWPTTQIAPVDTLLICGGVPTQLHGHPAGGSGVYSSHRWFGDIGPLSQFNIENPMFNTSMAGYYRLVYQVTDSKGCVGLDTLVVEVEKPVAMFTADVPSGCQPLTVNFTNGSSGYTSLLWNFGDTQTSTEVSPTHTYTNTGPALDYRTVRLEVTSANGCVSSMEQNITIYPEILSDFVISEDTICSGESVMFSLLPGAFRYYWNYDDGFQETGSNVISHVFFNPTTAPVTFNVTLRTESFFGCISETTLPVVVYPTPLPAYIAAPASQVFPAATVTFTNNTNPGTWTWLWNFDDGNTSADMSPVHTYGAPGDFDVSLTVSNGVCADEIVHTVRVLPTPPIASFDSIPSGCQPWNVIINNTSLYATTYYWDFGDGHTSNARNPIYTYVQAGTYQVTLTVTGPGGQDTESQIVHVYPGPRAYFDVSPAKVYVNDEEVRLFNLTEGGASFIWEFGDGDTSHVRDPYHKYTTEGIYDITLHAYSVNGCYDTYVMSPAVTVEPFGDLVFASVFKPNLEGPIEIDELPNSGEAMDMFFFPPIRETVLEYHMQIFNRWGTLIFETFDINRPWNGYYKGKLCQQGVYVWLVEGKYANGRPFKKAGDITLLH
ncbi:MAG: PKD-like domain-containing protein [Bacteroidales bacterium]